MVYFDGKRITADSEAELHAAAGRIGVKREYYKEVEKFYFVWGARRVVKALIEANHVITR